MYYVLSQRKNKMLNFRIISFSIVLNIQTLFDVLYYSACSFYCTCNEVSGSVWGGGAVSGAEAPTATHFLWGAPFAPQMGARVEIWFGPSQPHTLVKSNFLMSFICQRRQNACSLRMRVLETFSIENFNWNLSAYVQVFLDFFNVNVRARTLSHRRVLELEKRERTLFSHEYIVTKKYLYNKSNYISN